MAEGRRWIGAAAALLAAGPVQAGDWWIVAQGGQAPARIVRFADRDSLTSDRSNSVLMWEAMWLESPMAGGAAQRIEVRVRYDCRFRTEAMVFSLAYDADGRQLWTQAIPEEKQDEKPVLEGGLGETSLDFACTGPKPGQAHLGAVDDLKAAGIAALGGAAVREK